MRRWMLLVAVLVVALAGFAEYRLNGIFGSKDVTSTPSGAANDIVVVGGTDRDPAGIGLDCRLVGTAKGEPGGGQRKR